MTLFRLEPRDPVIFRDGRPFPAGAASARTLGFPWPQTIAGVARTLIGSDHEGRFIERDPKRLLAVEVRGPWLWKGDEPSTMLFSAPRDVVWFKDGDDARVRRRLVPLPKETDVETNLANLDLDLDLDLVGVDGDVGVVGVAPKQKAGVGPAFWTWREIEEWLVAPKQETRAPKDAFGLGPLEREERTHVAVDPLTSTARDRMLFSTTGLRFNTRKRERLALGFACDDAKLTKRYGVVPIGGERRIAFLQECASAELPILPQKMAIDDAQKLRVVLLTPAIFKLGAVPKTIHGARVLAAVVPRPEVISGWDFVTRKPKPTRRMAPAGSVYWVEVPKGGVARDWAKEVWMTNVSDEEQDRRDGFGLAVVGVA